MDANLKKLAIDANKLTWDLLGKPSRTAPEDAKMVESAYALLHLWDQIGTDLNRARGHWLVSRSAVVAGAPKLAHSHAILCEEFTRAAGDAKDFDHAYVAEAMARSLASLGKTEDARILFAEAEELGAKIADAEDKAIYLGDFRAPPWFDVRGATEF